MNNADDLLGWTDGDIDGGVAAELPGQTRGALILLTIGWVAAAAVAFVMSDAATRFLEMPLAAYLAGQGALMALVLAAVRIAQPRGRHNRSRSAATSGASAGGIW